VAQVVECLLKWLKCEVLSQTTPPKKKEKTNIVEQRWCANLWNGSHFQICKINNYRDYNIKDIGIKVVLYMELLLSEILAVFPHKNIKRVTEMMDMLILLYL
jgi:hypothetical protein